jgi:hypothetical protein
MLPALGRLLQAGGFVGVTGLGAAFGGGFAALGRTEKPWYGGGAWGAGRGCGGGGGVDGLGGGGGGGGALRGASVRPGSGFRRFSKGSPMTVTFPRSKVSQSPPNFCSSAFALRQATRASASCDEVVILRSLIRSVKLGAVVSEAFITSPCRQCRSIALTR